MELLEIYFKKNNKNMNLLYKTSDISEMTVRNLSKKPLNKWTSKQIETIAKLVCKDKKRVIDELKKISKTININNIKNNIGKFNLENRRYIGNKNRLIKWIKNLIEEYTVGESFFDVFAGTGIITKELLENYDILILNDFLFSNNIIYHAFFGTEKYDSDLLFKIKEEFQSIESNKFDDDYFVKNYGGKFFSNRDAMIIGEIRQLIENNKKINRREYAILIASLIYSADKIANTVGHYDAYRKKVHISDKFLFELINPLKTESKNIKIYRKDANFLVRKIQADVAFIDPPYNSRQYSRFYHVLEGITKWDKPKLEGVAMKPPIENMSEYSKKSASTVFNDLISNIKSKYIVVTYNNTYTSKSSSSRNKITHEEIKYYLSKLGNTKIFEMPFQYFNTGKTDLKNHKEFVFITEVKNNC